MSLFINYSGPSVGDSFPALSLGGPRGGSITSGALNNLFQFVRGKRALDGATLYRCLYISTSGSFGQPDHENIVVWVSGGTPSPNTAIAIGLGTAGVNTDEQTISDEETAPSGVTFAAHASEAAGLSIPDLAAGDRHAFWVRYTITAGAEARLGSRYDNWFLLAGGDDV